MDYFEQLKRINDAVRPAFELERFQTASRLLSDAISAVQSTTTFQGLLNPRDLPLTSAVRLTESLTAAYRLPEMTSLMKAAIEQVRMQNQPESQFNALSRATSEAMKRLLEPPAHFLAFTETRLGVQSQSEKFAEQLQSLNALKGHLRQPLTAIVAQALAAASEKEGVPPTESKAEHVELESIGEAIEGVIIEARTGQPKESSLERLALAINKYAGTKEEWVRGILINLVSSLIMLCLIGSAPEPSQTTINMNFRSEVVHRTTIVNTTKLRLRMEANPSELVGLWVVARPCTAFEWHKKTAPVRSRLQTGRVVRELDEMRKWKLVEWILEDGTAESGWVREDALRRATLAR